MSKRLLLDQEQVKELAMDALHAACRTIQDRLGVDSGDVAGIFFSGSEEALVLDIFGRYINTELSMGILPDETHYGRGMGYDLTDDDGEGDRLDQERDG